MRFTRIITAFIAALTAALLGLSMTSSAEASVKTSPVASAAAAKPAHTITYFSVGKVPGTRATFYTKGRLTSAPGYVVYLQTRTARHPSWRTVKKTRSNASTGRFAFKFTGPCNAGFQLVIRETYSYARTAKRIGKIVCS